jgi:hypothetical protein
MTIGLMPSCFECSLAVFAEGSAICKAFPNGIPDAIYNAEVKHDKPYPGDNGIIRVPGEPTYKD